MKIKNKKRININKKLLIVLVISLITILGSAIAYFTTSSEIENYFKAALYQNEIVEQFTSPDNWTPGTTTDKTITVKNTGSINMAVRVKYEEEWVSANGTKLDLNDSEGNVASIINFNEGWVKDSDGYFYYGSKANMNKVKPEETTTSFISGVTFNQNIKSSLRENKSSNGQVITYTSTGDGYDNATYKLTIRIETIQYDQANNVW